MQTEQWQHAGLNFEGLSLAGVRTCLTIPQHSLAFDIAQGQPHAIGMSTFLISHGHMDHASGIPYVISQKAMNSHRPARFIMPAQMVAPMQEIMRQWSLIEGHQYEYEFIPAQAGDIFPLKSSLFIRPFVTVHRIPSLGYSICRKYRKLKQELINLSREEIITLREQGEDPTEEKIDILVSFTGDTQIEFLDKTPEVRDSKILILEATYLDDRKSVASAKEWGHTHLDEIIPRLETISSEKIVLIHSSARYSLPQAQEALQARLPFHEQERVVLFPGR